MKNEKPTKEKYERLMAQRLKASLKYYYKNREAINVERRRKYKEKVELEKKEAKEVN